MRMLSDNIRIIEATCLAKNPDIIEQIDIKAHGFFLMLTMLNSGQASYHYEVLNLDGELLKAEQLIINMDAIDCKSLQPNTYILNVYRGKNLLYSFQLAIMQ